MVQRMGAPCDASAFGAGLGAWPRLHEEGASMQLGLAFLAAKASSACAWFDRSANQAGRSWALREM